MRRYVAERSRWYAYVYFYREWVSYVLTATLRGWKWLNKFLTTAYFRESSRPAPVTIICLTISGLHSHIHINALVLHEAQINLTLTCVLSTKIPRISVTQIFCT